MSALRGFAIGMPHRGISITGVFDGRTLVWYFGINGQMYSATTLTEARSTIDGLITIIESSRISSKILENFRASSGANLD